MNIRQGFRRSSLYALWRMYRERQQLQRFNSVLDTYLADCETAKPYSEALVKARLREKQSQRRPFFGSDGKLSVVAFGARNWEQYGLWPSFERISRFALSEYGSEFISGPPIRKPGPEMRQQQAQGFLAFVDKVEQERQVTYAFLYASGEHISDELLDELARRGIWTVIMSLDDKQQFFRPGDVTGEPHQLRVARQCDLYWTTWKTGTQIVLNIGGTPWYAPEAGDPAFYHPLDEPRDLEIVFVGQSYGLRADLVRYLRRRGFRVDAFGSGWPNGFVSLEQTVELYSRAEIVLGVGAVGQMSGVKHLKARDFEVPMCGALYLTSYNPELADHYRIGEEIICYSSFEECADLAHWVLCHPDEAQHIRKAALKRSLAEHTWEQRLRRLFSLWTSVET